jgi:hypothetical protein
MQSSPLTDTSQEMLKFMLWPLRVFACGVQHPEAEANMLNWNANVKILGD